MSKKLRIMDLAMLVQLLRTTVMEVQLLWVAPLGVVFTY